MNEISIVGLGLAKHVVSLCGDDAAGRVAARLRPDAVLAWFVQRTPCLMCSSQEGSSSPKDGQGAGTQYPAGSAAAR
jgi:hypothetical protein